MSLCTAYTGRTVGYADVAVPPDLAMHGAPLGTPLRRAPPPSASPRSPGHTGGPEVPLTRLFPVCELVAPAGDAAAAVASASTRDSLRDSAGRASGGSGGSGGGMKESVNGDSSGGSAGPWRLRIGYGVDAVPATDAKAAFRCPREWGGRRGAACEPPDDDEDDDEDDDHVDSNDHGDNGRGGVGAAAAAAPPSSSSSSALRPPAPMSSLSRWQRLQEVLSGAAIGGTVAFAPASHR